MMSDPKNYRKLRIFVASPGDVAKEREVVHAVAAELNRDGNVADKLGVTLEVLDWRNVTPDMGRPEQVILDELKVEKWDIFVGILWLRFGSPTGGIDPESGRAYDSGTEEEFALAYQSWQKNKRPRILFYRCEREFNPVKIDLAQLQRVQNFFARFDADRQHPGLYQTFRSTEDFEKRLRTDLIKLLFEYGEKVLQKSPPPPPPDLPGDDLTKHYLDFVRNEHGRIRLFGFLSHANIDVRLLDVFVSLRFSDHGREMEKHRLPAAEGRGEEATLTPPQVLQRAMQRKKSLLILGGPGSGKTTLLKYFAVCCLDADNRSRINLQRPLIPIFVPLRQIDPTKPFTEALAVWARAHNQDITAKNFAAWLHNPGGLVLLDGLDEVSDLKTRRRICEWIDQAAPAYGESTFVVTCRFTGYREAEGVALQTPHTRADVLDLNEEQQRIFLQQWFRAAELERLENHELNDPVRLQEIEQAAHTQAQAITEFLGKKENRSLADMAGIPVLLQIMAIIWREQGSLSSERVELYSRSMDYLLEHRDRTKKIEPLLSAAKARLVLRPLALWMQQQGKDETPREQVENQIAAKLQEVRPGTAPPEFLENIRDRAGVLVGAGAETNWHFAGDDLFTPFERRRGLPIGNLTSQFFANVYLNAFDHFVKEQLRCRFYLRYVDDSAFLHDSPLYLQALLPPLQDFLDRFRIKLHLDKCQIRPVECGQRFLGQTVFPTHRRLTPKNVRRFTRRMRRFQKKYARRKITLPEIRQSLMSWLGHARQANTWSLRRALMPRLAKFGSPSYLYNSNTVQKIILTLYPVG
jgi:energy-coupling factor transporter ATP-binding protein EcfA2